MNLHLLIFTLLFMNSSILFDFNKSSPIDSWRIIDDVVMGGRSNGSFEINKDGHGKFSGDISLENNGGFSSIRHQFETKDTSKFSKFIIHIKGDGKTYQFRVKRSKGDYATYNYEFKSTTNWASIEIPFTEMNPVYRGRNLNQPNFDGSQMEEIAFLIGNKKEESFELLIDKIELK